MDLLIEKADLFIEEYKNSRTKNKSAIFAYIRDKILTKKKLTVYTDGSCINNGKKDAKAGYGIYFGKNDSRNISQKVVGKQSNNTAELTSIIHLYSLIETEISGNYKINVYTDSSYCLKCLGSYGEKNQKNNWKKEIPNKELVKKAYNLYKDLKNVKFNYIKAHTGKTDRHSKGNEGADLLAKKAIGI